MSRAQSLVVALVALCTVAAGVLRYSGAPAVAAFAVAGLALAGLAWVVSFSAAAAVPAVDWKKQEAEILRHYQALIRIDTSSPPGNETAAVDYLSGHRSGRLVDCLLWP